MALDRLQCVAVCCSVLQCVAACCSVLQRDTFCLLCSAGLLCAAPVQRGLVQCKIPGTDI